MRLRNEDGASMVMVLLVVVFVALVSTAFLTKSGTEFKASSALQTKVRLQYGADAGLEKGISTLSAELANAVRTHCLTPLTPTQTVASFTWTTSGYPVTVTCTDLQGYAADDTSQGIFGAAIVITGGADSLITQSGGGNPVDVGGTIYLSGAEVPTDLKKDIHLTRGELAQFGCSGTPSIAQITVASPYGQRCTAIPASQVANKVALPAIPPTAALPVTLPGNNCRVFFPGKYTTAPALLSGNNTSNYFASGDYYFDGPMTISVGNNVELIAGASSPGDVEVSGSTPCSNDAAAKALPGAVPSLISSTGAAFYMGGDSHIDVAQGILVMHSRPITTGLDVPLSVYGVRSTDSGWDRWSGGANQIITTSTANGTMLFNGQINAYDAPVFIFASNPSYAAARAGIVAKLLTLKASASGTNLDVSGYGTSSTLGSRIVQITVTAAGKSGDPGGSVGSAVVTFPNDPAVKPTVQSWRFS